MSARMRALPVGDDALLLEVASGEEAQALHAELVRRRAAGLLTVREIVPAARTVLLDGLDAPDRLASELTASELSSTPPRDQPVVEIPVRYDGPDLADVAAHWGVPEEQVARLHAGTEFRVAFCGFAPGFGYLTGLPERYDVPRRSTPRTAVPAGSVGLAGPYTGVYPRSSPGGWQLIGTTDTVLWDHARVPAALLSPGTRVRFVPVGPANGTGPMEPAGEGDLTDTGTARTAKTSKTAKTAGAAEPARPAGPAETADLTSAPIAPSAANRAEPAGPVRPV